MSEIRFATESGLTDFLSFLAARGITTFAPTEKPAAAKPSIVFEPWQKGDKLNFTKATVPPKKVALPESEILLVYEKREERPVELRQPDEINSIVVFGCRPCDARGFAELDKPFLQGLFPDPYYKTRRENLTVISLTCDTGCETCFCHWVGGGPTSPMGSDVLLTKVADGYVLQGITPKGNELLSSTTLADGADKFAEAEAVRKNAWASLVPAPDIKAARESLKEIFADEGFWEEQTNKCISCGACTYFCPTCYCFNITDQGDPSERKGGRRLRSWDNCMSARYTREASGHNPRPKKSQRMRNRVSHKFWTFPANWGSYLCSGCGRCITNCPVHLDIRAIVLAAIKARATAQNK